MGGQTILIVDDEPDLREILVDFLSTNYRCIEAENGLEALKILETETPQLIITDLKMPVMDGIEFLSKLDSKFENTPKIAITAYTNTSKNQLPEGTELIFKPFEADQILDAITRCFLPRYG